MNYKPFPEEFWVKIKQTVADLKLKNTPLFAAFDADGTLWDIDLGENFFNHQIETKSVPLPEQPWNHYQELKKVNDDPRDAYVWLAQINSGQTLPQVRQWSAEAYQSAAPVPIFKDQQQLIEFFLGHGVKVLIVTASIKWAVEPGAIAIGLKPENVIGVETEISNDTVTNIAVHPITYKIGKVEALLKHTGGIYPFFASGNSTGDTELLKSATHLQLAVSAASRDDRLFQTENELMKIAETNNWMRHRFV